MCWPSPSWWPRRRACLQMRCTSCASPRCGCIPNNLIVSGAVHGRMSRHCLGVVCQTLPVPRYCARLSVAPAAARQGAAALHCFASSRNDQTVGDSGSFANISCLPSRASPRCGCVALLCPLESCNGDSAPRPAWPPLRVHYIASLQRTGSYLFPSLSLLSLIHI